MSRTRLTFAEISEALLAGKEVMCFYNNSLEATHSPFKLENGLIIDKGGDATGGLLFGPNVTHEIVVPKVEAWVNVYENSYIKAHTTKENADKLSGPDRIRCVKVEV